MLKQIKKPLKITAADIKQRHPWNLPCKTDIAYARLANDIYGELKNELSFMEPSNARNACVSLALYFEDIRSGLHLFEAFTCIYQKMFGSYLPFFATTGPDDPHAEHDAMRFMLWLCFQAEDEEQLMNPTNDGFKETATRLLSLWHDKEGVTPPNDELANYIYAEETQTDVLEVKLVLVWLCRYCPLGWWFTTPTGVDHIHGLRSKLEGMDKRAMDYTADCYALFDQPTWPVSVAPQHVYAEMIRIDMDNPDDPLAAAIDQVEGKPFAMCRMEGTDSHSVCLKDFRGDVFSVSLNDFKCDIRRVTRENTHVLASFIRMNGQWSLNGPCFWLSQSEQSYEEDVHRTKILYNELSDNKEAHNDFVRQHGGERLYFFRNMEHYKEWLHTEMGISQPNTEDIVEYQDLPFALFFAENGQMLTCLSPECICHPNNPFYERETAQQNSTSFVASQDVCNPKILLYLIEHSLLPDAKLNDIRGWEHGHRLMQENMEFIMRCMRRDITSDQVFHKRHNVVRGEDDAMNLDLYYTKIGYNDFVKLIADEDTFYSKADKEWQVVSANRIWIVVRDVNSGKDYTVSTHSLYEAYLALSEQQIKVAALEPFVGKENVSAATALLYRIGTETQHPRIVCGKGSERGGLEEFARLFREKFNNQ